MLQSKLIYPAAIVFLLAACKKESDEIQDYNQSLDLIGFADNTTLPRPDIPADNQLTPDKVHLGRMLFYENDLSRDGSMNCASCHIQENGFSDPRQFSVGVEGLEGGRQAMTIINLVYHDNGFFWDGRAELLRHQAIMPIQDPLEMNETMENVINKLSNQELYTDQFEAAFGDNQVTEDRIALALEAFMFTIISDDSKFDRFRRGEATLTASEERGRQLFFGRFNPDNPGRSGADCASCHGGPNFDDDRYINIGLDAEADITDLGREGVTGNPRDRARFKTPTLRNIEVTAPYMHDGRFNTLEEVIDHYDHGVQLSQSVDQRLARTAETGLGLSAQDKVDLVNFLKTLTDQTYINNPNYKSPF